MRIAGRLYSVVELAQLAQCRPHELEYLSEIELLVPQHRSHTGYCRYDDVNLLRLQQIRIGRARGLALEEIRRWLAGGAHDGCALGRLPSRAPLRAPLYLETEAKVEGPADRMAFASEADRLYAALAARQRGGAAPEDAVLRRWAERHCCHINRWFCPCDARQHIAFGRAMARHPLHAASIERHGDALAAFMLRVLAAQRPEPRE